ncbi:peroxiredoxin [Prosthecomicrobium pneumaticum]|uniref:Glutathione-dependent peroxiredoxin n=1 Tax=Prosthecomicrobium pneumaticum TaxID=81895 RepID=A0A7W9CUT7_9HYPH|nr:peroxiredoxin [Prosthecomicrobium pneumaticum]MBB5752049.1 peroxiredoxin [Prosthecomicrobium pneumaticum]
MTITVGDRLPDASFKVATPEGFADRTTGEIFAGRKVVLFAVPGAFTPTCHRNHLPGYVEQAEAIRAKGVDEIAVVSVNDHHVMKAWAEATGAAGKITFLADGSAVFTQAVGLDRDLTAAGMGVRSQRYAMIVEDGVVTALNVEDSPGSVTGSGAAAILALL